MDYRLDNGPHLLAALKANCNDVVDRGKHEMPAVGEEVVTRDAGDDGPSRRLLYLPGKRWAVIIGVFAYKDRRLTLRYAHRDAKAVYDFLLTPAGGAFSAETMQLLIDDQATTRNVTRAMSSFLAAAAKDDLVLIYLACHGTPPRDGVGKPAASTRSPRNTRTATPSTRYVSR